MKIGPKILTGFIVLVALVAIIGISGILSIQRLTDLSKRLYEHQSISHNISAVLNAHFTWRQGLTQSLLTGTEFAGSRDPETCALGVWLKSEEARNITDPVILSLLADLEKPHAYIHNNADIALDKMRAGNKDEAVKYFAENILPGTQLVVNSLTEIERRYNVLVLEITGEILVIQRVSTINIIVIVCIAVVISIFLSVRIPRSIIRPLGFLTNFMGKATATGDISISPADAENIRKYSNTKDELAQCIDACVMFYQHVSDVAHALEIISEKDLSLEVSLLSEKDIMGNSVKKMLDIFNEMLGEIYISAEQISSSSRQIADGAQALAQSATEQASTVDYLSVSVSDIAEKTKANTALAERAAILANTIKDNAEHGSRHMDELLVAVRDINEANQSVIKVIKAIDDIAFQTNILALNAAVEAARAGAAGKGFAVVADEVRNLAAKSAEAAKSTGELIANSIERAEMGSRIADETESSLAEIVTGINESSRIFNTITDSAEEQYTGIRQLMTGIDQVAHVASQNSSTAQESASASEEMSGQFHLLEDLIKQFRLRNRSY